MAVAIAVVVAPVMAPVVPGAVVVTVVGPVVVAVVVAPRRRAVARIVALRVGPVRVFPAVAPVITAAAVVTVAVVTVAVVIAAVPTPRPGPVVTLVVLVVAVPAVIALVAAGLLSSTALAITGGFPVLPGKLRRLLAVGSIGTGVLALGSHVGVSLHATGQTPPWLGQSNLLPRVRLQPVMKGGGGTPGVVGGP